MGDILFACVTDSGKLTDDKLSDFIDFAVLMVQSNEISIVRVHF